MPEAACARFRCVLSGTAQETFFANAIQFFSLALR